jgi:O-antigen/teichoic acid export membrane protein
MSTAKIMSNMILQVGGKAITAVITLVIIKLLTAYGPAFYGQYVLVYEYLSLFGTMADAGIFAIAVREISQNDDQDQHLWQHVWGLGAAMTLFMMLLSLILAPLLVPHLPITGVVLGTLTVGATMLVGKLTSPLQIRMRIWPFTVGLILSKIIQALAVWGVVWLFKDADSAYLPALLAGVLGNLGFLAFVAFWVYRFKISLVMRKNWTLWRKLLTESIPYGLALVLQTLYLRIDILIISRLLGATATGIYGVGARMLETSLMIGMLFGQSMLPKFSSENGNPEAQNRTLGWALEFLLMLALPVVIIFWHFSGLIVTLVSTPAYLASTLKSTGSDTVLSVLGVTILFAYMNQTLAYALVGAGRQRFLLVTNGLGLIVNVILNFIFLPTFGIIAAAWNTVLCEISVFLVMLWATLQHTKPSLELAILSRILIASLSMILIYALLPLTDWWLLIAGAVVYGLICLPILLRWQRN